MTALQRATWMWSTRHNVHKESKWSTHMADPSGVAEYQRVAEALRALVRERPLQAGDEMPSMQEIMDRYRVSPMVARRALLELRIEGVIKTRQGKRAIVVDPDAARKPSDDVAELTRLVDGIQDAVSRQDQEMADLRQQFEELRGLVAKLPGLDGSAPPAQPSR